MPSLAIKLFHRRIHSFQVWGLAGFIAGITLSLYLTWRLGLSLWLLSGLILLAFVSFLLLAWIQKLILKREILVYYHHEIAIVGCVTLALAISRQPVLPYLDVTLTGIGAFLSFGRIGCFHAGCCHGRPAKFGVRYNHTHVAAGFTAYYEQVTLFPVQLVESMYVAVVTLVSCILILNHAPAGTAALSYTVGYGVLRYMAEFFRGDPERPYWWGLSEAQWTTLFLVGLSLLAAVEGYLPLYAFHAAAFAALALASIAAMYLNRQRNWQLRHPHHVRELAGLLKLLPGIVAGSGSGPVPPVVLGCTRLGICISAGATVSGGFRVAHYTVSAQNPGMPLSLSDVQNIAEMLGKIERHPGTYRIIHKQSGVAHILFEQKEEKIPGNRPVLQD